jgi:EAL domain-containing protein (putative c-di-GMP-specific phosphodiesterase class I)
MVRAIIQLAHGLGMMPLAEGVETEAQWRFLTERGCSLGQGYQFGHPVPAEAIAEAYVRGIVTVLDEPAS